MIVGQGYAPFGVALKALPACILPNGRRDHNHPVEVAASTIQRGNHHVEKALDRLRNDGLALRRNGRGTSAGYAAARRIWAVHEVRRRVEAR